METEADFSGMRIVVVDDDDMVLRSMKATLGELGFKIQAFNKPRRALEWIDEHGADIVVSDIYMPDCDGFELLRQLKEIDPSCDLIFVTAHGQMDIAIRALREGATDFFEKPFTAQALRAAIERTQRFRALTQRAQLLTDQVDLLTKELLATSKSQNLMIGQSDAMRKVADAILDLADSPATVTITGESGTGKELVANAIHQASSRSKQPFLTLNCASIPEDLFESEMFGHRRGAFTGALETRGGYVEAAKGGTLFLDEIGDLPLTSQPKILRLLEQRTYLPVGETKERQADVRIVAATNKNLRELVDEDEFREDLFYRLSVCEIDLPPLRDRKDDIPLLALFFTLKLASEMDKHIDGLDKDALVALAQYDYPGNVRELRNIIERSVIHCKHAGVLTRDDLPDLLQRSGGGTTGPTDDDGAWPIDTLRFEDVEQRLYKEALARAGNNVSAAARLLGLSRGKLRRRLEALNIEAE
jgi:DNA-binding NtrC family response regulator